MYPMRPAILVPTLWLEPGSDPMTNCRCGSMLTTICGPGRRLELMVRTLRDKAAYEAPLIDENNAFLLALSVFPYFLCACRGTQTRSSRQRLGRDLLTRRWLRDAFEIIPSAWSDFGKTKNWARCWGARYRTLALTARSVSFGRSCASRASITPKKDRFGWGRVVALGSGRCSAKAFRAFGA